MAIYKLNQHSTESESSSVILTDGSGVVLCIPFDPENTDYQAYLEWKAIDGNEPDPVDELTWDDIRATRDEILSSTDWTMTTGATVDQAQWAAYRQVIRDIPQTYSGKTPDEVVWPTQPSTAGPNT